MPLSDSSNPTNALVAFRARNVRCYRDEVVLTTNATRLANQEVVREVKTTSARPDRLLPVIGVFGANASGKSALLKAISDMRSLILGSFRGGSHKPRDGDEEATGNLNRQHFLLGEPGMNEDSEFEVELIIGNERWRYGFTVNDHEVVHEFASHYPRGREALLFERNRENLKFGSSQRRDGRLLTRLVRPNALALSVVGALADHPMQKLFKWWLRNNQLAEPGNQLARIGYSAERAQDPAEWQRMRDLLMAADLGLSRLEVVEADVEEKEQFERIRRVLQDQGIQIENPSEFRTLRLAHRAAIGDVALDPEHESGGTKAWIGLLGPLLHCLDKGVVILVDELDASLHPALVERLVELFQNPGTNPRGAQLIFNAHNPSILDQRRSLALGRDQIWFTEKDGDGASTLYPLSDFRGRKDEAIDRRYLHGRYGGTPALDPGAFEWAVSQQETHPVG